jgi:hypothetical protein
MHTHDDVERVVEHVAEVCDSVEFLHGVPVKLPSKTKALLRGRIRNALTTQYTAGYQKGVEAVVGMCEAVNWNECERKDCPWCDGHPPCEFEMGYFQAKTDIITTLRAQVSEGIINN